jgi:hypothetical protein
MSKTTKLLLSLGLVAFVAACAAQEPEPVFVPEPISVEPAHTGKYK